LRMSGLGEGLSGAPEIGVAMMFLWMALLVIAAALSVVTAMQYAFAKPETVEVPREQETVAAAPKASLEEPPPSDAEVAPWAGS
jgi:hypothetical protein